MVFKKRQGGRDPNRFMHTYEFIILLIPDAAANNINEKVKGCESDEDERHRMKTAWL